MIAWILRIARNACYNELRTRNRWSELSPEEENQVIHDQLTVEEILGNEEDESRLKEAIVKLPPQQKMALLMVVQEEKSHAEVALELKCSVGAVKVLLFRARENLKKRMEES